VSEVDSYDISLARRAQGLLRDFNTAQLLSPADVHVAQRLGRLGDERDERVLLAAALAVRGARLGSVVVDLARAAETTTAASDADDGSAVAVEGLPWPEPVAWLDAVAASSLVAVGDGPARGRPLRLVEAMVSLERYWGQETQVARDVRALSEAEPPAVDEGRLAAGLARLFPDGGAAAPDPQRLAAAVCALGHLTVLAGGPGTGKTTTVARVLALLHDAPGGPPRVALAAPTGKAAARLTEAVHEAARSIEGPAGAWLAAQSASTLHRLLGWRRGSSSRFRHDRGHRLPFDVIVVDETSMVSLTMMARLLEAVRPDARLLLVGDPDQLASVEAGAVLGDLVGAARAPGRSSALVERLRSVSPADAGQSSPLATPLDDAVVRLTHVHRFDERSAIAELAGAVRRGDPTTALALLRAGSGGLELVEVADEAPVPVEALVGLRADVISAGRAAVDAARRGDAAGAVRALEEHRVLCAHRRGPRGEQHWSARIAEWLAEEVGTPSRVDGRYVGQPLLVTANDYDAQVFNGDTGIVVDGPQGMVAAFGRGAQPVLVPLARLGDVVALHAMTVHRSQGSQLQRVTVVLPPAASPLATRETLYTAVTRARRHVRVVGSAEALTAAIDRPVARASGLGRRLAPR